MASPLPFAHPSSPAASAAVGPPRFIFWVVKDDATTSFHLFLMERPACLAESPQEHLGVPHVAISHHQLAASPGLVLNTVILTSVAASRP